MDLGGWRCPALKIPGAEVNGLFVAGNRVDPAWYEVQSDLDFVRWVRPDHPEKAVLSIKLTEELSTKELTLKWKKLAIILPILTSLLVAAIPLITSLLFSGTKNTANSNANTSLPVNPNSNLIANDNKSGEPLQQNKNSPSNRTQRNQNAAIQAPLENLVLQASNYKRSTHVGKADSGCTEGLVYNWPPNVISENAVEYDFNIRGEGTYQLFVTYSAGDSRPVDVYLNGEKIIKDALAATTGGFCNSDLQRLFQGEFNIKPGSYTLRFYRNNVFPHLKTITAVTK